MRLPFLRRSSPPQLSAEWLVVGLGNPGPEYARTRHNVGFRVIDRLGEAFQIVVGRVRHQALIGTGTIGDVPVVLVKPQTYMNLSGESVRLLMRQFGVRPERVLILTDDMELPAGRLRLRARGSAGGHNGLKSLIQCLETDEFPRIKIGVGRPGEGVSTIDHVLGEFGPEEAEAVEASLGRAAEAVEVVLAEGLEAAMNRFNRA